MQQLNWQQRRRILSPDDGPEWRSRHCGMVSALPTEDGYRMFLTGRDEENRFQIGMLDLDESFNVINEPAQNPILPHGRLGCFDCMGVCMPMVVRLSDSVLYMYYVGWSLCKPGLFVNRCGLAISRDNGQSWARWSEAPLALVDERDPIGIGTVFVRRDPAKGWQMWYTTFRDWEQVPHGYFPHYHIKYAESDDGIHWQKPAANMIMDFIDDQEYAVARPMIVQETDGYRMWFCRRSHGDCYRIGYAESDDGRTWERKPSGIEPAGSGWDSEMIEYAFVIPRENDYLMFYNGNGYGASGTGIALAAR